MSIRLSMLVLLGLIGSANGLVAGDSSKERPNILFIYSDDQSHRTTGCYPESPAWVRTPNIDRIAQKGVRFTHAYIGTWCMPSRATMLTGHHQHGIESMQMKGPYPGSVYDPDKCPFWPRSFKEKGYVTAQIGKWHTGTDVGFGRDWDHQIVWNRPLHTENATAYYRPQILSFDGGEPTLTEGYSTDNYTRWAEEFIRGKNRDPDKPWYLWLCYGAVHGPYTPAERHKGDYADQVVPVPADIYPNRPGKPTYAKKFARWKRGSDDQPRLGSETGRPFEAVVQQYNECVKALDEGVGRVMKALEESGQLENTLVVYTSDQGFAWGQHGMANKQAPYDASLRCPMIVSMPGTLPEGEVCRTPISGVDLPVTFFSFAGLELPWPMHGRDLMPLIKEPKKEHDHPVLVTFTDRHFGSDTAEIGKPAAQGIPWYVMLVEGRYKYIRYMVPGEIEELYHLDRDPDELVNLALSPEYEDLLGQMREATLTELRRTKAPFVDNLPKVRTAQNR